LKTAYDIKEPYRKWEIYNDLSECYYSSVNYKKALYFNKRSRKIHDSLQVSVNDKQVSELDIKYEAAQKDEKIMLLDRNEKVKTIQIMVTLGGSLLV
jgi:hypothetical protein